METKLKTPVRSHKGKPSIVETKACKVCGDVSPTTQLHLIGDEYYCNNCSFECDGCHKLASENGSVELSGGGALCLNCQDDLLYRKCEHCGRWEKRSEMVKNTHNDYICYKCRINEYVQCTTCEDWEENDDTTYIQNYGYVCNGCFEGGNYQNCCACDDVYQTEGLHRCLDCSEFYCDDCYSNEDRHSCNQKMEEVDPSQIFEGTHDGKIIKSKRLAGCEIEAEGKSNSSFRSSELPLGVVATDDGSLNDGVEVVTPPASLDKLEDIITRSCKCMISSGLKIEDSCGLHIHLDMREYRDAPNKLVNVMQAYWITEAVFFAMVPHERRTNRYCKSLRSNFDEDDFVAEKSEVIDETYYKHNDMDKHSKYCEARYYWVNLHSVYYRGTLEIRLHSGTINEKKILYWIALHQAMIDYAVSDRYDQLALRATILDGASNSERLELLAKLIGLSGALVKYYQMRIAKFS